MSTVNANGNLGRVLCHFQGSGGSRRAPWEGRLWRAAPLPATPICAEQLAEGRLLLSTTSNTYILEGIIQYFSLNFI